MAKYNINDFYVGVLLFPYNMGGLFYKENDNRNIQEKRKVFYDTVLCGAIDLRTKESGDEIDWQKITHIIKLFTIFHKVDDNHLLCLHNRQYYKIDLGYCTHLIKLVDVLPKIDIIYNDSIRYGEALKLFRFLFQYNNIKICENAKTEFDINSFYQGETDLCTNCYIEDKNVLNCKSDFMNLPEDLILSNNPYLYQEAGYTRKEENKEYSFSKYNTLFIKTPNGKYYNLNNYHFYNLDNDDKFNTQIIIQRPFVEELEEESIAYPKKVTIPKVLKLQKKLYDRK